MLQKRGVITYILKKKVQVMNMVDIKEEQHFMTYFNIIVYFLQLFIVLQISDFWVLYVTGRLVFQKPFIQSLANFTI